MNFENSKKCHPHRLQLNLFDKINFKIYVKYLALSNLSIYYSSKNIKRSYKSNKFKKSALTWNEHFQLLDESS